MPKHSLSTTNQKRIDELRKLIHVNDDWAVASADGSGETAYSGVFAMIREGRYTRSEFAAVHPHLPALMDFLLGEASPSGLVGSDVLDASLQLWGSPLLTIPVEAVTYMSQTNVMYPEALEVDVPLELGRVHTLQVDAPDIVSITGACFDTAYTTSGLRFASSVNNLTLDIDSGWLDGVLPGWHERYLAALSLSLPEQEIGGFVIHAKVVPSAHTGDILGDIKNLSC